jgi:hypothetical protein
VSGDEGEGRNKLPVVMLGPRQQLHEDKGYRYSTSFLLLLERRLPKTGYTCLNIFGTYLIRKKRIPLYAFLNELPLSAGGEIRFKLK